MLWKKAVAMAVGKRFPFRRAPGGLAMQRCWVLHHAAAAAQSYCGSCELPASLASNGRRDTLATTSQSHGEFVQGSHPPLHVSGPDHLQTRLQMSCLPLWMANITRLLCARAHRPLAHLAAYSHAEARKSWQRVPDSAHA